MSKGINPLHSEPNYVMFGPGAGVSQIVRRDNREPLPPYEPILLLRATDPKAPRLLYLYAEMLAGEDPNRAQALKEQAHRMQDYRAAIRREEVLEIK